MSTRSGRYVVQAVVSGRSVDESVLPASDTSVVTPPAVKVPESPLIDSLPAPAVEEPKVQPKRKFGRRRRTKKA